MRLGGSVTGIYKGADAFIAAAKECKFRSVTFPLTYKDKVAEVDRLMKVLAEADIKPAEVGAWGNNPLNPDKKKKKESIDNIVKQLELAEYIGAPCCVNVAGSHSDQWDGPSPDFFTETVFSEIVQTVQEIIDRVNPVKTTYTLETMPYMIPYSVDSYSALVKAVNRQAFSVHLDIINLINNPEKYYSSGDLTRDFFNKLGKKISCIHVKDIILAHKLTVHLDECQVGTGGYDLTCLLQNAAKLSADIPLLAEHLGTQEEYKKSIDYLDILARNLGLDCMNPGPNTERSH